MAETPKPQQGTWTLTAPDGRTWQAESPLRVVAMEQRERIPAAAALERIFAADIPNDPDCTCGQSNEPRAYHHSLSCPHSTPWSARVKARLAAASTSAAGVEGSKP